ncbi:hypothetical protein H9Y05_05110 [Crocinitomicaceae bacterium CZZ-1]|uniref:Lipoprotein n=1 Tax=Taishania pollutisoli TaxID=2766479 RepID=A0A8J6P875_9FLAO|nr:hypothetical protein [Taishania pollutisoli]MBC9811851.1 hypothetical protein [Taishania pollutisoli]MBX2948209.1 hypothetical protein [Crocinitomicaceae bacterium]NGF75312.1 hypothetical protein [Fluviicola sp. SGL-29]
MKRKPFLTIAVVLCATILMCACKKKETGICYCKYLSGDKKQFDLRHLPRTEQIDSCYVYNQNASHFAGECELE